MYGEKNHKKYKSVEGSVKGVPWLVVGREEGYCPHEPTDELSIGSEQPAAMCVLLRVPQQVAAHSRADCLTHHWQWARRKKRRRRRGRGRRRRGREEEEEEEEEEEDEEVEQEDEEEEREGGIRYI